MDTQHTSGLTSQFKFEFIKQITNNFSEDRIIGSGAYGVVYKGVLDNGEDIAVKKLIYMPPNHDSEKQFHNECTNLMRVKHQNIVRLVGYCHETRRQCVEYDGNYVFAEENERALCFEYLEGGSLEKYVSDKPCRLDWDICYKIIKGVCEGLNHLHNGCAYLIFHLDLKPANILLDKSMMPKIGDFGLSRLFSSTETCTTSTPLGTMGYTPPEYVDKQEISPKYDVFSLGVMIIHMMAGRTHYYDHVHTPSKIIELVCENWNKRLHATMCSDASQEVKTCIEIALRCVKSDRHERPTISQIIDDLNRIGIAKLPFKPQATNLQSREALDSNQYINSVSSDEVEGNDRPMQDPMDYVHGSNESIMRDLASGATEGYASRVISRPRDVAQGTEVNFLGDGHRRRNHHIRTRSLGSSVASEISDLKDVGEHSGRYGVRDPENGKKKSIFAGSTVYLAAANEETTRRLIGIKKPVGVKDIETTCGLFTMEAVGDTEATIKSLLGKLGGLLAEEEYLLIGGVLGDIQFINDELTSMQAFLSNRGDDLTKYWMKQVGDVSKDIEDCVDQFPFAHGIRPDPRDNGLLSKMQTWYLHRRVAAQISDLKKRAKNVGKYRRKYLVHHPENGKKKSILAGSTGYLAAENQETTRRLNSIKKPVGVKDIEKLEKWISSEDNKMKLGVLSIVGFGGVGKTTIALALYRKYGDQFQHRAVVTVSQNSDPEAILRNVMSQVRPQANSEEVQAEYSAGTSLLGSIWSPIISPVEEKNEGLQEELKSYLKNRYLLLIDDVWSSSTWQSIKKYFPENDNGSRIIVTTRFQAVATTCFAHQDNDYIHIVNFLSNDEPRDLFQKSLLECNHTAESRQSWRKIPERVWGMCGGMPLAIVTMAGLVASNMLATENEWTAVCNSLFPEPEKCRKPEDFTRIINFCYNDLPGDVKTCTLYLSIFPKGRKISSKRLIRRWIAEGFLTEKLGLSVEDAAETCFNQLIERKIVRPVEYSSNGRVKSCHVHDMVLEYIISKAAEENFVTVVGGYWSMKKQSKVRRLSLHRTDSNHARKVDSMNLSHVRSLTVFGSLDQLHFMSFKTGILRVLDLEGCRGFNANHFSVTDICEMTLLKYLSLRGTNISKLP